MYNNQKERLLLRLMYECKKAVQSNIREFLKLKNQNTEKKRNLTFSFSSYLRLFIMDILNNILFKFFSYV